MEMYEDETLQFESFKEMLRLMKIRHCLRFEMTNLFDGKGISCFELAGQELCSICLKDVSNPSSSSKFFIIVFFVLNFIN